MQGKTSTVGGGGNNKTSGMWNDFLQNGLGGNPSNLNNTPVAPQLSYDDWAKQQGISGDPVSQQGYQQYTSTRNQLDSASQTGGGNRNWFNQLVEQQRNQTPQGLIKQNPYLQQAGNLPQAPGFVNPQLQQYNQNVPTNDIFSQLFGPGSQFNIRDVDQSQFGPNSQWAQAMSNSGQVAGAGSVAPVIGADGIGQLLNPDTNSPYFQALKAQQAYQDKLALANINARFGAGGGQSLGTSAQFGNAQYLAQANPANSLALNQIGTQQQMLDMQNRQASADALLGQRGQDVTARGQDVQANIAGAGLHQQGMMAAMQAYLQAMQSNQQADISKLGIGQTAATNQAQNALQQFLAGNQAIGAGNADQLNLSGQHNTFNRDIYGQQSQNQAELGRLGLGITNTQQGGIQNLINQMFGSYNQANQIGSPQAQTVQKSGMSAGDYAKIAAAIAAFL